MPALPRLVYCVLRGLPSAAIAILLGVPGHPHSGPSRGPASCGTPVVEYTGSGVISNDHYQYTGPWTATRCSGVSVGRRDLSSQPPLVRPGLLGGS